MPLADKLVRWSMTLAVVFVGSIAALISYSDIRSLVLQFGGESGFIAALFPLCVDGLLVTSNLTLLFCARYQIVPPRLARITLSCGIFTTLSANISHGLTYGAGAAIIDAWPALSLTVSTELLWWVVASSRELDTKRTVFVVPKQEGPSGAELTKVAELIANSRDISGAEIARQTGLPYPKALSFARQARAMLNGR